MGGIRLNDDPLIAMAQRQPRIRIAKALDNA